MWTEVNTHGLSPKMTLIMATLLANLETRSKDPSSYPLNIDFHHNSHKTSCSPHHHKPIHYATYKPPPKNFYTNPLSHSPHSRQVLPLSHYYISYGPRSRKEFLNTLLAKFNVVSLTNLSFSPDPTKRACAR